jgi:hypothetical protein
MNISRFYMSTRKLCIALLALTACTHDLTEELPDERNSEAKTLLAASDFAGARDEYQAVLDSNPSNMEAAFGWALADLLLLLDSQPVNAFLDTCNQPHFMIARDVFGPNGVLAQAEAANAGNPRLTIHHRDRPEGGATDLRFAPEAVKSELQDWQSSGSTRHTIYVSVRERTGSSPRWLSFSVNVDDVIEGDQDITPLRSGLAVDVARMDGWISVFSSSELEGGDIFGSQAQQSGRIVFEQIGTQPGDRLVARFERVIVPTYCSTSGCGAFYEIEGSIDDTLSAPVRIDQSQVPFGELEEDPGPPYRDELIVALDRCSPLTTEEIGRRIEEVGDLLARESMVLEIVTRASGAASFTYTIPKKLLHAREDLPISIVDARALKAAIDLASAFVELAAQYQYLQGTIQELIDERDVWIDDLSRPDPPMPVERRERSFTPASLAMALDAAFLVKDDAFELGTFRSRLDEGLAETAAALKEPKTQPGIFDFQALPVRRLSNDIAAGLEAVRASITSASPVSLPSAPLYQFHLKAFFDAPLDQDRLEVLSGLSSLWSVTRGDPNASYAYERNDHLEFEWAERIGEQGAATMAAWTGDAFAFPADKTAISCGDASACGEGYDCVSSRCESKIPYLATSAAWDGSARDEWPVFVNPIVRDALDFGF